MSAFDNSPPLSQGVGPAQTGTSTSGPSLPSVGKPGEAKGASFVDSLLSAVEDVDQLQDESTAKAEALASGEDVPLHDLLIAQERADVSFRLLIEVRNQLVDAWREVTRGPI